MDLEEYPKEKFLKDGSVTKLRPMIREDTGELMEFFTNLPENEKLYLREDVINPEVVKSRAEDIDYNKVLPILAIVEGRIVGVATLYRGTFSWMRHVGNIRITVSPAYRQKGVARHLTAELFNRGLRSSLEMLVGEIVTGQDDVLIAFKHLGFKEEAILKDRHLDPKGGKHDLIIMSNDLNLLWKKWTEYSESVSGTWHMED